MPEVNDQWLHFSPRQPKRKRAELVCIACHSKKIKCDLQTRSNEGRSRCTACENSNQHCQIRPSNRGKQRHVTFVDAGTSSATSPSPTANEKELQQHNGPSPPLPSNATPSNGVSLVTEDAAYLEVQYPTYQHSHETLRPSLQRSHSNTSPKEGLGHSHSQTGDVDTGFLHIYGPENQRSAEQQELAAILEPRLKYSKPFHDELLPIFADTYFEYCYPWCPVLDRETLDQEMENSPLLANAVALAASHIRPPLTPHEGPAVYYNKARSIFYFDEEADSLTALKALSLFYWWAPRPPSTAHRHSSWWWTSIIIRIAQQLNFHREPADGTTLRLKLNLSLRRRIWWTAFARERLTALCQTKPCIIDPADCTISEVQPSDFPDDPQSQRQGKIFLYWTRLCGIMGKAAKHQSHASSLEPDASTHLVQELASWAHSLPLELRLSIKSARVVNFDRDIYQLHLPYLTTIIVLHLRKSTQQLPQAFPPAILAASCIARLMRDILSRGETRWLMAITCWYIGTAYIALIQATHVEHFAAEAHEGLDVLERTVKQLETMWGSAEVIRGGFERLRKTYSPQNSTSLAQPFPAASLTTYLGFASEGNHGFRQGPSYSDNGSFDWTSLFPFVSPDTNHIAQLLLSDQRNANLQTPADSPLREVWWHQYQDLLQPVMSSDIFDFTDTMSAFI